MKPLALKVLHVEDNPGDARLVREYLAEVRAGLKLETVGTLAAALERLSRPGIDVVLLDLGLPDSAGLETLRAVQSRAPDLPTVVITGLADEELAIRAVQAGAQDHLIKAEIDAVLLARALHYAIERKRSEHALRESEARYRSYIEATGQLAWVTNAAGEIAEDVPSIRRFTGQTFEEARGLGWAKALHPDDLNRTLKVWQNAVTTKSPYETEYRMRRHDGVYRDLLARGFPVLSKDGDIREWVGTCIDITERKRIDEGLRESEARFRSLFDNAQDGMVVADVATRKFLFGNRAIHRMLGYTPEELGGLGVAEIHPPKDLPAVLEAFGKQARQEIALARELPVQRKDGSVFFADINTFTINLGGKPCLVGMFRDVTEFKQVQEQLRQAQKMEAIGNLAGGVAHDFNNILMVINGYSQLLLMDLPADSRIRPQLEEIKKAGDRAAALTRQLLMISRKQVVQPDILDLNATVKGMEKMLRRLIREDIELRMRLAADLWKVKADPGQMEQVLLNLAANARDAMPQGGKLTIETANTELDAEYARTHVGVAPGRYALLAVSDTGTGIAREHQSRLFEPFFTTKEAGKGTGLGLPIVHGIVKQHGGSIWFYSEPGKGTTFKVYLPRVEEAAEAPRPAAVPPAALRGTETILLVEDEAAVRTVVRETLAGQGYVILEAFDGAEALQTAREHGGAIDLLITDMIMPRMGGPELAGKLGAARPGVKVLFMSGYADHAAVHNGTLSSGSNYLQKPFTLEALTRRVREILDAEKR